MSIYTRTGDDGKTSMGKKRCPKDCPEAEIIGEIDELTSLLGVIAAKIDDSERIEKIISDLMSLNAHIASEGKFPFKGSVEKLEREIDGLWKDTGQLNHFILRFTDPVASEVHYTRAVCRRVERTLVSFARNRDWLDRNALRYVNRLSDYLFSLARWVNKRNGGEEVK